jgi:hypothetical protein
MYICIFSIEIMNKENHCGNLPMSFEEPTSKEQIF